MDQTFIVRDINYNDLFQGSQQEVIDYFAANPPGDTTRVQEPTGIVEYATIWLAEQGVPGY